jgi:hypothetical protein
MSGVPLDKCSLLSLFIESIFWGERNSLMKNGTVSLPSVPRRSPALSLYDHDLPAVTKEIQYSKARPASGTGDSYVHTMHHGKCSAIQSKQVVT